MSKPQIAKYSRIPEIRVTPQLADSRSSTSHITTPETKDVVIRTAVRKIMLSVRPTRVMVDFKRSIWSLRTCVSGSATNRGVAASPCTMRCNASRKTCSSTLACAAHHINVSGNHGGSIEQMITFDFRCSWRKALSISAEPMLSTMLEECCARTRSSARRPM